MKPPALSRFRYKLQSDEPVYGLWVTLEAAAVTEIAVGLGLDWVVIDAEHGHLDWAEILEHVRATVRSNTVALVGLAEADPALIHRALDLGADGVVIPTMETAEQLLSVVAWSRSAPKRIRDSNANALVVPIIETVRGRANIRAMIDVEGVDVFVLDPLNCFADRGSPGELENTAIIGESDQIVSQIRDRGKHAGVAATTGEALAGYVARRFGFLGVGLDGDIILEGIQNMLNVVGKAAKIEPTLAPRASG